MAKVKGNHFSEEDLQKVKEGIGHLGEYDLNHLRGWQRSQIQLLKEFANNRLVDQTRISGASGMRAGSHAMGGKITALTRSDLIVKAGKDDEGKMQWQLNDDKVDRQKLLDFIEKLGV